MRSFRGATALAAFVLLASMVGVAWAYTVRFPSTLKPKATVLTNEVGEVVFGAVPAKVELTNCSPSSGAAVQDPFSVHRQVSTPGDVTVFTVPGNKRLVITDIEAQQNWCCLTLLADEDIDANRRAEILGASGRFERHFTSGVVFEPNEEVIVKFPDTGFVTLMGKLVPVS